MLLHLISTSLSLKYQFKKSQHYQMLPLPQCHSTSIENNTHQLFTVGLSSLSPFDLYIHLIACMLQLNIQSTSLSLCFHQKILVFPQLLVCSLPLFTEILEVLCQLDEF